LVFDKKESEIQSSKGSGGVTMLDGMGKKSKRIDQTQVQNHESRAIDAEYEAFIIFPAYVRRVLKRQRR